MNRLSNNQAGGAEGGPGEMDDLEGGGAPGLDLEDELDYCYYQLRYTKHEEVIGEEVRNSLLVANGTSATADVMIICDGNKKFLAHRVILAGASPWLKTIFQQAGETYERVQTIYLPNVDFQIVEALLRFIYNGEITVSLGELQTVKDLMQYFQIEAYTTETRKKGMFSIENVAKEGGGGVSGLIVNSISKSREKKRVAVMNSGQQGLNSNPLNTKPLNLDPSFYTDQPRHYNTTLPLSSVKHEKESLSENADQDPGTNTDSNANSLPSDSTVSEPAHEPVITPSESSQFTQEKAKSNQDTNKELNNVDALNDASGEKCDEQTNTTDKMKEDGGQDVNSNQAGDDTLQDGETANSYVINNKSITIIREGDVVNIHWDPVASSSRAPLEYKVFICMKSCPLGTSTLGSYTPQQKGKGNQRLPFVRVYHGVANSCSLPVKTVFSNVFVELYPKPAIVFRIRAQNASVAGPITQIRWQYAEGIFQTSSESACQNKDANKLTAVREGCAKEEDTADTMEKNGEKDSVYNAKDELKKQGSSSSAGGGDDRMPVEPVASTSQNPSKTGKRGRKRNSTASTGQNSMGQAETTASNKRHFSRVQYYSASDGEDDASSNKSQPVITVHDSDDEAKDKSENDDPTFIPKKRGRKKKVPKEEMETQPVKRSRRGENKEENNSKKPKGVHSYVYSGNLPRPDSPRLQIIPSTGNLRCSMCSVEVESYQHFLQHIKIHNFEGRTVEEECDGESPPPSPPSTPPQFVCRYCKKEFQKKACFESHVMIHTGEKPFQCIACDSSFRQKVHLTNHIVTYHCRSGDQNKKKDTKGKPGRPRGSGSEKKSDSAFKNFTCHLCNQVFSNTDRKGITKHLASEHPNVLLKQKSKEK